MLDSRQFYECLPEFGYEEFVMITDDFFRHAILAVPVLKENLCKIFSCPCGLPQQNLDICPKSIHHRNDAVKLVLCRERAHEVDHHGLEVHIRYRQGVKGARGFIHSGFVMLARGTGGDIGQQEVLSHIWPVIQISQGCI